MTSTAAHTAENFSRNVRFAHFRAWRPSLGHPVVCCLSRQACVGKNGHLCSHSLTLDSQKRFLCCFIDVSSQLPQVLRELKHQRPSWEEFAAEIPVWMQPRFTCAHLRSSTIASREKSFMLTFAGQSQHDPLDQFHNELHNVFVSVPSEINCAFFCLDRHPPKFVSPTPKVQVQDLVNHSWSTKWSVSKHCFITILAGVCRKNFRFCCGFGICPWCSSLHAVLFLSWWRVPVVNAHPHWTVVSVRKFLTSLNCLERRFWRRRRSEVSYMLRERRSRALARMHAWRSCEWSQLERLIGGHVLWVELLSVPIHSWSAVEVLRHFSGHISIEDLLCLPWKTTKLNENRRQTLLHMRGPRCTGSALCRVIRERTFASSVRESERESVPSCR